MKILKTTLLIIMIVFVANILMASTHIMKKGDTLWDLAAKYYGDPSLYPLLLQVNGIDNPRTIPNGRVVIIPSKSEMTKIALEKNTDRREKLIDRIAKSADKANNKGKKQDETPKNIKNTGDKNSKDNTINRGAKRYSGYINNRSTSFKNILKGPKVSGDKLISMP